MLEGVVDQRKALIGGDGVALVQLVDAFEHRLRGFLHPLRERVACAREWGSVVGAAFQPVLQVAHVLQHLAVPLLRLGRHGVHLVAHLAEAHVHCSQH